MLLSPRPHARCPTGGCLSIGLNKPFQSLCCGDSCGTAQERGPKPSCHPVPHFHPRVIKQSAGQAGTGAEAAAPSKICSISPPRNGAREWEGKEGGGGFPGIGGSILHQLTQVKATTDVGGMSRAGGGRGSARTGHSGGLCVTPGSSGDMPVPGLLRKPPQQCLTIPERHPLPVPAKSAGSGMTLFFWMPSPKAKLMSLKRLPSPPSPSPPQRPATRLS